MMKHGGKHNDTYVCWWWLKFSNLIKMKVKAPKGYHWMKQKKSYKLMKDPSGGYKPHKGASKSANFEIQKVHKK